MDIKENVQVSSKKRLGGTHVSAYLILKRQNQICLLLRQNTGYMDGCYGLISGHVEDGESATDGMIREAREEAGIELNPAQLKVVHVMHRNEGRLGIDVFFECFSWSGSVENREPHKCAEIGFFPQADLPKNTMDYVAVAIQASARGEIYSERGWK
jgi:8-oxo-dGTP diphosphatase